MFKIYKIFFISLSIILFISLIIIQAADNIPIWDVLKLAEKNDVGDFVSVKREKSFWFIKAVNLLNNKPCEMRISLDNGIIEYCNNVTPRDFIIGENTYGFANKMYPPSKDFYKTGNIVNGFIIYSSNDRFLKSRRAIFIQNKNLFLAYFIYKGPDVIKGGGLSR